MVDYTLLFEAITAIATLAVPVVVAVIANRVNKRLKQWEATQWRNQELIKARLEYYKNLVPQLNDLMCYFAYIGGWKDFKPAEIVKLKRTLDKDFYCAAPLFDHEVLKAYDQFMNHCFATHNAWGLDAKLRTEFVGRKRFLPDWDDIWNDMFAPEDIPRLASAKITLDAYNTLIGAFARNIEFAAAHGEYVGPNINFRRESA